MRNFLLILFSLICFPAFSQDNTNRSSGSRVSWTAATKMALWNENFPVEESNIKGEYRGQLSGLAVGLEYRSVSENPRWVQSHVWDVLYGQAHVTGTSGGQNDNLKVPWYGSSLSFGVSYRTSKVAEIRLGLPLLYRTVQWKGLRDGVSISNKSLFTYGFEISSGLRLSPSTSITAGFSTFKDFPSMLWELGMTFRL